jgi:catechol 2,3-dioxygenase-like lactoylglutathione lyase family enzyme
MSTVNARSIIDDVEAAVASYTTHLGSRLLTRTFPAFADVTRDDLRLLLSRPTSSAGRPLSDGRRPIPGGWNRIHLIVEDLTSEVERWRKAIELRDDVPRRRQVYAIM